MKRITLPALLLFALAPHTSILGSDSVQFFDVRTDGDGFEFSNSYEFGEGTGLVLRSGELCTGGIMTIARVTFFVDEIRTRIETRERLVFVNGRFEIVTEQVLVEETVRVPVTRLEQISMPEVKGTWYGLDDCGDKSWSFFSTGTDGTAIGWGSTSGTALQGSVIYLNSESIPSGIYRLSGSLSVP